ncbi:hypothetical protein [Paenibacillus sp. N3.4]|uniref:hypothetical protein n=1 Tax=Paenibacillus sp. N3.4 TaxID=2603222 RepID=UPI00164FD5D7|nr:hypothetical protein [Paenibacillus sp. N3.4]
MAKRQKSNSPRKKRMKHPARLQAAKTWIKEYTGKNVVRGYSKHFGVDLLCAVRELEMIGVVIDSKYKQQLKTRFEYNHIVNLERKQRRQIEEDIHSIDQDSNFYLIAGYTSNGFPYGITCYDHKSDVFGRDFKPTFDAEDYYYIAGYTEEGGVFGITWSEYLWSLNEMNMFIGQEEKENIDEDEVNFESMFGEGDYI